MVNVKRLVIFSTTGLIGAAVMFGLLGVAIAYGRDRREGVESSSAAAAGLAGAPIPVEELPVLERTATAFEQEMLADGRVTHEELIRAFTAAEQCISAAARDIGGVEVSPADYTDDIPRFGGFVSKDKASLDQAGQAELSCVQEYFDHVYAGYGMAASYAAKQAIWDRTGECLRAKGYVVAPGANRTQLALAVGNPGDNIDDFYTCEARASRP